jgi:hypothetical protein
MEHLLQYDWSISTATQQDLLIQSSPLYFDHHTSRKQKKVKGESANILLLDSKSHALMKKG